MNPNEQPAKTEQPANKVQNAITEIVEYIAVSLARCDDEAEELAKKRASLKSDLDIARKALAAITAKKRQVKRVKQIVKAVENIGKTLSKKNKETK